MQIKMNVHYQGTNVSAVLVRTGETVNALAPDEVYEVDANTAAYLLEHNKGEQYAIGGYVKHETDLNMAHYGAQSEPELRHDDEIYETIKEENPIMITKSTPKRTKRNKS